MLNQQVDILIVEDNEDDAILIIDILKKLYPSVNLLHMEDGEKALHFIFDTENYSEKSLPLLPKLILLDLKMPKINGIEVLERIKGNSQTKSIPIVILTSSAEDSDIQHCYALGANSFVVKPINYEDFTDTIIKIGTYWRNINK